MLDLDQRSRILVRKDHRDPVPLILAGRPDRGFPIIPLDLDMDIGPNEREPGQPVHDVPPFGSGPLQEFSPSGYRTEQIRYLDARTLWPTGLPLAHQLTRLDDDLVAVVRSASAAHDAKPGNGSDRGQCLAAKTEAADPHQIRRRREFARRVALEGHRQFSGGHP